MANHESTRTTGLYDRRDDQLTLDEVPITASRRSGPPPHPNSRTRSGSPRSEPDNTRRRNPTSFPPWSSVSGPLGRTIPLSPPASTIWRG